MHSLKPTWQRVILKNKLKIFVVIVIVICVIFYHKNKKDELPETYFNQYEKVASNVSCHYLEDGDALPSAEDWKFTPRTNSIFFHETSCRGRLTSRQACAIEAAARTNSQREVYVLFSAPVNELILTKSNLATLKVFPNVKFSRVHIEKYAENTPLEELIKNKPFQQSHWWVEHTSDLLRCLTMYKWGGIYLDTDMLVVRSLTPLGHNWVVKEDNNLVNAAAIAISTDRVGRGFADAFINELKSTYRPDVWIHNGPGAITRVLHKVCTTQNTDQWSLSTCGGVEVYGPEYFYPVHYGRSKVYFQSGELNDVEKKAYAHHFWNKLTFNLTIEKDSPFMKIAREYCPTIVHMYGDKFGI